MRTRNYRHTVVTFLAAALAIGLAALAALQQAEPTLAGSAGTSSKVVRESASVSSEPLIAGSKGDMATVARESS